MDEETYLKMQFEKGCDMAKAFIDTRYKILSFVGLYNAAVLSFAFKNSSGFLPQFTLIELSLCGLSIFVMIMAIATEYINYSYFRSYMEYLKKIESKYGENCTLCTNGIFSFGWENTKNSLMYRKMPVYKAHRIFYSVFLIFWIVILIIGIWKNM